MAVNPMAMPAIRRRIRGSSSDWCRGDMGCSSSTPTMHAEIMNSPSAPASIRYSGQWLASAASAAFGFGAALWGVCRRSVMVAI